MHITATFGPSRRRRVRYTSWLAASIVTLMLLAQLFHYEDFASTLAVVLPFNDQPLTQLTAAMLVIAELFALPYLLAMRLSPLMRVFGAVMTVGIGIFWLFSSLTSVHASNSALFGSTLIISGPAATALATLLAGMLIYIVLSDLKQRSTT